MRKPTLDSYAKKTAKLLNTDLVEATFEMNCCDECTKYRGRVFSISGLDRRFPKLPKYINCDCFGISFHPFLYGISKPTYKDYFRVGDDIISFSNRPFVIERTEFERQTAIKQKAYEHKQLELHNRFSADMKKLSEWDKEHRSEYEKLCNLIPEFAPKSLGGYTRMKLTNSKNFQKLADIARAKGLNIQLTDEKRAEFIRLREAEKEYQKLQLDLYFQRP